MDGQLDGVLSGLVVRLLATETQRCKEIEISRASTILVCRTAWSLFVGIFVACISHGRTLREIILYCLVAPVGFCLVWFTTWGGIGMRQSRQARELEVLGETWYNNSGHFLADSSKFCYDVPQEDVLVDGDVVFTNHLLGVTPVCQFDTDNSNAASFNVLYSFRWSDNMNGGLGPILSVFFIVASALYFVTSSDSATFVVDSLASNGRKNQHWARQSFWAITIGALASALLSSGGSVALKAVQAASIVCAIPVVILMCYMIQSIQLFCVAADKSVRAAAYALPSEPEFAMPVYGGVLNIVEYLMSWGKVHPSRVALGMHEPTRFQVVEFMKGLCVPFVSMNQVLASTYPQNPKTNIFVNTLYTVCYVGWVILLVARVTHPGLISLRWTSFIVAGFILGKVRAGFRARYNSNIIADMTASIFCWPQVFTQMRLHCASPES
jgi:BCCT, betaine/carnitine/choline family transporter